MFYLLIVFLTLSALVIVIMAQNNTFSDVLEEFWCRLLLKEVSKGLNVAIAMLYSVNLSA